MNGSETFQQSRIIKNIGSSGDKDYDQLIANQREVLASVEERYAETLDRQTKGQDFIAYYEALTRCFTRNTQSIKDLILQEESFTEWNETTNNLFENLRNQFQANSRQCQETYDSFEGGLAQLSSKISTEASKLSQLIQEQSAQTQNKGLKLKVSELKKTLGKQVNVDEDSICIVKVSGGGSQWFTQASGYYLRYIATGLKMTPDENPYQAINGGAVPSILLPDAYVYINLTSGKVTISGVEERDCHYMYSGRNTVNPHIINEDGGCCWGDFGVTLTELIVEHKDFNSAAYLIGEFLSQANNDDSAGRYWPLALYNDIKDQVPAFMSSADFRDACGYRGVSSALEESIGSVVVDGDGRVTILNKDAAAA